MLVINLVKKLQKKSGDLIMKKLAGKFNKPSTPSIRPQEESTDMILNRLISESGIKRRRKIVQPINIMAFRSSEYLQRNELVRYQLDDVIRAPGNNQHQIKSSYTFTINDRSAFYDWYNAYFEVHFQLPKIADRVGYAAADRITIINGAHSLVKHLMIKSSGKIVYDTDNLHNVTWNILMITADLWQKTVFGTWILTILQQTQIQDLKHAVYKPKPIMITVLEGQKMLIPSYH